MCVCVCVYIYGEHLQTKIRSKTSARRGVGMEESMIQKCDMRDIKYLLGNSMTRLDQLESEKQVHPSCVIRWSRYTRVCVCQRFSVSVFRPTMWA